MKAGRYEYEVVYHDGLPNPDRKDSVFFDSGLVATVGLDGYAIDIFADGKTTLRRTYDVDHTYYLCSPQELIDDGIDTDEKLSQTNDDEDYYWAENNWFDLYENGQHLDQVTHSIDEAIENAKAIIGEHTVNVCFIENDTKPIVEKNAILVL